VPPYLPDYSQSPSICVIFPSIVASDGCSLIGKRFPNTTASVASGALSTVGLDHSTYTFNFGHLPSPLVDVGWVPAQGAYSPSLAPPSFLFGLDPALATCIPAASQGIDPYTTLTMASAGSGPGVQDVVSIEIDTEGRWSLRIQRRGLRRRRLGRVSLGFQYPVATGAVLSTFQAVEFPAIIIMVD